MDKLPEMLILSRSSFFVSSGIDGFEAAFRAVVNTRRAVDGTQLLPRMDEVIFPPIKALNGEISGKSFRVQYIQHRLYNAVNPMIWEGEIEEVEGGLMVRMTGGVTTDWCATTIGGLVLLIWFQVWVIGTGLLGLLLFFGTPIGWYVYRFPKNLRKREQWIVDALTQAVSQPTQPPPSGKARG